MDYLNDALKHTSSGITRFFNAIDFIDRKLYGKKMQYFLWSAISVLVIAPLLDWSLEIPHDRLTYLSTFCFLILSVLLVLCWIGAWRDDNGNWTWTRARYRFITYYEILRDISIETRTNPLGETLYKFGRNAVVFAVSCRALQNLSVFVRKPIEHLYGQRFWNWRHNEQLLNITFIVSLIISILVLYYVYYQNPQIWTRIKNEIRNFLSGKSGTSDKYINEIAKIDISSGIDLVVNAKEQMHVELIVSKNKPGLFNDFMFALQKWNPRKYHYEYEYKDNLVRHLKKELKGVTLETEKPISESFGVNKGRADVVINDTILIEMKRDSTAGSIQRAKGQIMQYSNIWKDKGPVVLLLCDFEFTKAKESFNPTMSDLVKLERPAITIVGRDS